jgi:hypothetical protein
MRVGGGGPAIRVVDTARHLALQRARGLQPRSMVSTATPPARERRPPQFGLKLAPVLCAEISAGAEMSADPVSAPNPPSRLTSIKSFDDI